MVADRAADACSRTAGAATGDRVPRGDQRGSLPGALRLRLGDCLAGGKAAGIAFDAVRDRMAQQIVSTQDRDPAFGRGFALGITDPQAPPSADWLVDQIRARAPASAA
jgi:hypothetical protein